MIDIKLRLFFLRAKGDGFQVSGADLRNGTRGRGF